MKVLCACGCGVEMNAYGSRGRLRRYLYGHQAGRNKGLLNFWNKVDKTYSSGCWVWLGARTSNGYGSLQVDKVKHSAHRLSYELSFGPIPEGMYVLHSCDNPICVNPAHLFIGSQTDNMHDAIYKGIVEGVPLSDQDVVDIRERHELGETINSLARFYGSSVAYLWKIVRFEKRRNAYG